MSALKPVASQAVRDELAREARLTQPLAGVDVSAIESRVALRRIFELLGEPLPEPAEQPDQKSVLLTVSEVVAITGLTRAQVNYDLEKHQLPSAVRRTGHRLEKVVDSTTFGQLLELRCVRGGQSMARIVSEHIA